MRGRRIAWTVLVALLGGWLGRAAAQVEETESPIAISISQGTLVDAIKELSEQTGVQITADLKPPEIREHPVAEIDESLTPRAALSRILEGSGHVAEWHSPKTARVYPVVAPHGYGNVNEVLVTGSRIADGGEGPAPVRVYGREEIDRLGVSSAGGLAGYFTQQPFSAGEWSHVAGAQYLQMRGLGVDSTLVLINGRRASPSASSDTLNAFDLNTIPLTAIDRIEVMSDSASAIYGADAIGGVVNIILRTNIESPDLHVHYGASAGGAEERRVAGSFGKSSERFKAAITLDYFERGMLVGAERDIWRDQDYRRFGGTDYRVPMANPGNVYALGNEPLPGLLTRQASVPVGSTGVGLTPEDFSSTAGVLNLDSFTTAWSILPASDRKSVFGSAEFSPRQSWSIFGEALWTRSSAVAHSGLPALVGQIVPADNPYNPFGVAVAVDYSMTGMKPIARPSTTDLSRFVLGARSKRQRWDWELVLTASDEQFDLMRINELDLSLVQAALEPNAPGGVLNLFSDGPAGDATLLSSLVSKPLKFGFFSGALQLSGFVQGELFEAPGGASEVVVGGEWRQEKVSFFDGATAEQGIDVKARRDIASWFAEIKLPLLEELTIKMAVRGDSYEASKDSINPQYGFVWRPTRDWLVRAAYGTSFRPPSLVELFALNSEFVLPVLDPRRGGAISHVRVTGGGNPDLENVAAHSITTGVTYQPRGWPDLKLGVHYWRVAMDNRIVSPQAAALDGLEASMPDRVRRSEATEEDRLAGWPGPIESIDMSLLNYGSLETDGIDLDLSYGVTGRLGRLQSKLSATWVDEYASQEIGSVLPEERIGIANNQGTIPRWRLVGSLAWERQGWGASAVATFTPRYRDSGPEGVLDRHLPSRTIVDLQAWLQLDQVFASSSFDELKVTAGVLNLFDKEADFANVGRFFGYDLSIGKLQQRFAYIRVSKAF